MTLLALPIFLTTANAKDECDSQCQACLRDTKCPYDDSLLKDIPADKLNEVKRCRAERALKCIIIPDEDVGCKFTNIAKTILKQKSKEVVQCIDVLVERDCKEYEDEDMKDLCKIGARMLCKEIESCLKESGYVTYETIEKCYRKLHPDQSLTY